MPLISKKQIRRMRLWVLSDKLEQILLLMYILCFTLVLILRTETLTGVAFGNDDLSFSTFQATEDMQHYFMFEELDQLKNASDFYAFLLKLQNKKLWIERGRRAPYWPLGATRIVQHRVNSTEECASLQNANKVNSDLCVGMDDDPRKQVKCMMMKYGPQCNFIFKEKVNEHGYFEAANQINTRNDVSYSKYGPDLEDSNFNKDCVDFRQCSEFNFMKGIGSKGFQGLYGMYPPARGYKVDLTGNRSLNAINIEKLKKNRWIDDDTRAIQVMFNVFSVWSNKYYYIEVNLEMPYSNQDIHYRDMKVTNLFFYQGIHSPRMPALTKKLNIAFYLQNQTGEFVFHSLLLINCVLFTFKIMFELQLGISKVTNVGEFICVVLMFLLVVSKITEIILKNRYEIDFFNDEKFLDLSAFIELHTINRHSISTLCFFFPFKILNYLAHFEFCGLGKTLMNTLARTVPGVIVFLVIGTIITGSWAAVFHF